MAFGDYILCCKCEVKLIYDGDRSKRKLWEQRFGKKPEIKCPDCEPKRQPLPPQSPCEMTPAERKMFRLGWLECEAAHGITGEK
jgi:hypothetical protein